MTLPLDWLCGEIVCLHKKGQTDNPSNYRMICQTDNPSNYRMICLLSHIYKVLSVVLLKPVTKCIDKQISESQNGFCGAQGTRTTCLWSELQSNRSFVTEALPHRHLSTTLLPSTQRPQLPEVCIAGPQCTHQAGELHHAHQQQCQGKDEGSWWPYIQ